MTRKEFIEKLQKADEENISIAQSLEDAEEIEYGGGNSYSFTPVLERVNGRLYIVEGSPETG